MDRSVVAQWQRFANYFCTVTTTGELDCPIASECTCTTLEPGRMVAGICAEIWLGPVCKSGSGTSLNTTHDPPSTVGTGSWSAVAAEARLAPMIVMKEPALKFALPSLELMIALAAICGCVDELAGVDGITLRP